MTMPAQQAARVHLQWQKWASAARQKMVVGIEFGHAFQGLADVDVNSVHVASRGKSIKMVVTPGGMETCSGEASKQMGEDI